jgi:hypothetical protein
MTSSGKDVMCRHAPEGESSSSQKKEVKLLLAKGYFTIELEVQDCKK